MIQRWIVKARIPIMLGAKIPMSAAGTSPALKQEARVNNGLCIPTCWKMSGNEIYEHGEKCQLRWARKFLADVARSSAVLLCDTIKHVQDGLRARVGETS